MINFFVAIFPSSVTLRIYIPALIEETSIFFLIPEKREESTCFPKRLKIVTSLTEVLAEEMFKIPSDTGFG